MEEKKSSLMREIRGPLLSETASPSHKIVAALFDLAVMILASIILLLPALAVFIHALAEPSAWRTFSVFLSMFASGAVIAIVVIAYFLFLPYVSHGQTLGLRFFRMRLVNEEGKNVSFKSLLVRSMTSFLLFIFTCGLYAVMEFFIIICSDSHRSFIDVLSGTYTIDID